MKVRKIVQAYRQCRGDYEIELKRGETVRIYGEGSLISHGEVSNILKIKCETRSQSNRDWAEKGIDRTIEVEVV